MITTLKSGVKIGFGGDFRMYGSQMGRSWQHLIDQFEKDNGEKVDAIRIDPEYGIMFRLK